MLSRPTSRSDALDAVYVLGDMINGCPWSAEVLDRLLDLGWPMLLGNHDDAVLQLDTPRMEPRYRDRPRYAALWWTREQLADRHLAALAALPLEETLTLPGVPALRLLHGLPGNFFAGFRPDSPADWAARHLAGGGGGHGGRRPHSCGDGAPDPQTGRRRLDGDQQRLGRRQLRRRPARQLRLAGGRPARLAGRDPARRLRPDGARTGLPAIQPRGRGRRVGRDVPALRAHRAAVGRRLSCGGCGSSSATSRPTWPRRSSATMPATAPAAGHFRWRRERPRFSKTPSRKSKRES